MKATPKIGLVIPVANESQVINRFVKALVSQCQKLHIQPTFFFVIDKASRDDTKLKLQKLKHKHRQLKVVYAPHNRHVVDAYVTGFKSALAAKCDWIIEMDCGFSHLPTELPVFLQGLRDKYQCVFGVRQLWSPSYPIPIRRRVYSLGGTILANVLLGTRLSDMTSGYEAFTAASLRKILAKPLLSSGNFWHVEMKYRAKNLRIVTVPITYQFPSNNVRGKTISNSFAVLWALAKQRWLIEVNKFKKMKQILAFNS